MKTTITFDNPVISITEIFCSLCGVSLKTPHGQFNGLIEVPIIGGYESTHLQDGDVHHLSICESCLTSIFNYCKYPTFQGNYITPESEYTTDSGEKVVYVKDFDPSKYWDESIDPIDIDQYENVNDLLSSEWPEENDDDIDDDDDDDEDFLSKNKKEDLN